MEKFTIRVYDDGTVTFNSEKPNGDFVATRADGDTALLSALRTAQGRFRAHDTDGT